MRRVSDIAVRIALLAIFVAGLWACGSGVQFVPADMTKYPPKPDNSEIAVHEGATMTPHVVIGTLTAHKDMKASFNDESTYDQVMKALKKEARKVGADALINVRPVNSEDTSVIITATAIHYMQETGTVSSQ